MQKLNSIPPHNLQYKSIKSLFSFFSSLPETQIRNSVIFNYLIETLHFHEQGALAIADKYSRVKSTEQPQSVVQFFQNLGFSESHIRSSVSLTPRILFYDVDKALKPKIEFFQRLGLAGSDLGKFISKNSMLLTVDLEKKLIPCTEILKQILVNDRHNAHLIRVICKCYWIVCMRPELRLLNNIAFLKCIGISDSQLSILLTKQPRIFVMEEARIRDLICRVLVMGFSMKSKTIADVLYIISWTSEETFERKFEVFRTFGFSEHEYLRMFRTTPWLLRFPDDKLRIGIKFFLNVIEIEKAVLVNVPWLLLMSMKDRVIPRYKVLQIVKSKKLLEEEPSFVDAFQLDDEEFLERFVKRFGDDAEELLVAYKCSKIDSFLSLEEKS